VARIRPRVLDASATRHKELKDMARVAEIQKEISSAYQWRYGRVADKTHAEWIRAACVCVFVPLLVNLLVLATYIVQSRP